MTIQGTTSTRILLIALLAQWAVLVGASNALADKRPGLYSFQTESVRPGGEFAIWATEGFIKIDQLQYPPFALLSPAGQSVPLSPATLGGTRGDLTDMREGVMLTVPPECPPGQYDLLCSGKPTGFPVTVLPALKEGPVLKISPSDGDDAAALNQILADNKDKNPTIVFAPGTYAWKSIVHLPPGVTLKAECLGNVHVVCTLPKGESFSVQITDPCDAGLISNIHFHGDPRPLTSGFIQAQKSCKAFTFERCIFEDFSEVSRGLTGATYRMVKAIRTCLVMNGSYSYGSVCEGVNPRYHGLVVEGKSPSLIVQHESIGTDRGIILRAGVHGTKISSVFFRDLNRIANGCEGILAEDANVDDVCIDHVIFSNCLSSVIMIWFNEAAQNGSVNGWRINDVRTVGGSGCIWLHTNKASWVTDMRFTNIELDGWIRLDKGCQGIVFDGLIQRKKLAMDNQTDASGTLLRVKTNEDLFTNNATGTIVRNRIVE